MNITDFSPRAIDSTVGRSKALAELADTIPFLCPIGLGSTCKITKHRSYALKWHNGA
jgi:hypothetical protein